VSETPRRIIVLLAAALAVLGLAACGGAKNDLAVRVGKDPISVAAVDHWMSVVAAGASTAPGQPKLEIPQPPSYTACIAYEERYPLSTAAGQGKRTRAALKAQCDHLYRKLKLKALYILISFDWVSGEAAELGVKLADTELRHVLTFFEHQHFPKGESFKGYLASNRMTLADITQQLKQELLVNDVQRKLNAQPSMQRLTVQQRQQVLNGFGREYEGKWRHRTDCQTGYVVPICRQYRPPKTPPDLVPNAVPLTDLAAQ
jgi:hypothetical protein